MSYKGTTLSKEAKDKIRAANTKPKYKIACKSCGNEFEVWFSRLKKGIPKYCSAKCYGKYLKSQKPWNKGITAKQDSRLATGKRHGMYGKKSPRWSGGRFQEQGYIFVWQPSHSFNQRGYVREHRLVVEKNIRRYLTGEEVIHHINGIKTDNRIENLKIMSASEHSKLHNEGKSLSNIRLRKPKSYGMPLDSGRR